MKLCQMAVFFAFRFVGFRNDGPSSLVPLSYSAAYSDDLAARGCNHAGCNLRAMAALTQSENWLIPGEFVETVSQITTMDV